MIALRTFFPRVGNNPNPGAFPLGHSDSLKLVQLDLFSEYIIAPSVENPHLLALYNNLLATSFRWDGSSGEVEPEKEVLRLKVKTYPHPLVVEAIKRIAGNKLKKRGVTTMGEIFEVAEFLGSLSRDRHFVYARMRFTAKNVFLQKPKTHIFASLLKKSRIGSSVG